MLRLTEGRSRPSAAMTSAGSTSQGIATELLISHDDPVLELINLAFTRARSSRILLLANPGNVPAIPLPHRDSQGRQTAASMRLCGNRKAKPSRGEGRERTGGRAATEPQTRCWRGPKEADHGATSNGAAVVFPLVGGSTHTKQR
jgi:hypothetical protein